ncbi:peptidase inhibitor family I36 protein [Lentzea albidocapillata]|uniref:Peptidase inhibitor family I36 n=1 Tax=Lentzea albidocapillata TaxID=40571 RepID=A0A1W2DBG8_9PSEU|nr:peptidase inhibitor family I36 protein [Lentzea albidocapillata]SMC94733.1 Peptidase inhibitor family I36 [Lentzea albidocapillata]
MVFGIKKVLAGLAVAFTAMTALSGGTAQAGAIGIAAYSDCPPSHMCGFEHEKGGGRHVALQQRIPDLRQFNIDNQVTSGWNRSGVPFCWFTEPNFQGARYQSESGSWGYFPHNDAYSSVWRGTCR